MGALLHEEIPLLVSEMIDRTLAEWLYPGGDEHPTFDTLSTALAASASEKTFSLGGRVESVPRDGVLEIGSELIRVKSADGADVTALSRAISGSTLAAHSIGDVVTVDPLFTRIEVLHALRALIAKLPAWGLYNRVIDTSLEADLTQVMTMPTGTLEVLSIMIRRNSTNEEYIRLRSKGKDWIEFKEFDPIKIRLFKGAADGAMTIVCKKGFTLPDSEDNDLDDAGVPETLQEDMPMALAGMVLKGREVPRAYLDRIRELLSSEGQPPGSVMNVGETLLSMFRRDAVAAERRRLDELDEPTFEWQRR